MHRLRRPMVHRGLKPANVLIQEGAPRITDFGIGGAAVIGQISDTTGGHMSFSAALELPTMLHHSGTLRYSSPEQLGGDAPDPRDDVYALGVMLCQLLLGGPTAEVKGYRSRSLRRLGGAERLSDLIGDSTSDRTDRPRNAAEWADALGAS